MKKIIITLTLGFIVSIQSFASENNIKNSKEIKLEEGDYWCIDIIEWVGECPDGSQFIGATQFNLTDCDAPNTILAFCIEVDLEAGCD